jgi:hypothetical protein
MTTLAASQRAFEGRFAVVQHIAPSVVPISTLYLRDMETGSTFIEHQEVIGRGVTPEEAVIDWNSKLPDRSGSALHWRVAPEIEEQHCFDTKTKSYRIYSRFVVIP